MADLCSEHYKPEVKPADDLNKVIIEMTEKRLGVAVVTDNDGKLLGVITDGDLRRMLEKTSNLQTVLAKDIMSVNPKTIEVDEMAVNALDIMRQNSIMQLIVLNNKKYAGIVHLHDLVKEGLI